VYPTAYFLILWLITLGGIFSPFRSFGFPYSYLGLVPIATGIVLNLWTDRLFKKRKTTVKPDRMPTHFEKSGPFRISRHPMYLGMALVLFGTAVMTGCLLVAVTSLAFIYIMEKKFIPLEEANMEKVFGREYTDYRKHVRKWI
jgi:protein-S-isoprenylcysteine O-methyltransferase Ste14